MTKTCQSCFKQAKACFYGRLLNKITPQDLEQVPYTLSQVTLKAHREDEYYE